MSVETYKVLDGKKVTMEMIEPDLLEAQLAGGWFLSKEEAIKEFKKEPTKN